MTFGDGLYLGIVIVLAVECVCMAIGIWWHNRSERMDVQAECEAYRKASDYRRRSGKTR